MCSIWASWFHTNLIRRHRHSRTGFIPGKICGIQVTCSSRHCSIMHKQRTTYLVFILFFNKTIHWSWSWLNNSLPRRKSQIRTTKINFAPVNSTRSVSEFSGKEACRVQESISILTGQTESVIGWTNSTPAWPIWSVTILNFASEVFLSSCEVVTTEFSTLKSSKTSSLAVAMASLVESSKDSFSRLNSSSFLNKSCFLDRVLASANNDTFFKDSLIRADLIELLEAHDFRVECDPERDLCTELRPVKLSSTEATWDTLSSGLTLSSTSHLVFFASQSRVKHNSFCNTSNRGWNHRENGARVSKSPANFAWKSSWVLIICIIHSSNSSLYLRTKLTSETSADSSKGFSLLAIVLALLIAALHFPRRFLSKSSRPFSVNVWGRVGLIMVKVGI